MREILNNWNKFVNEQESGQVVRANIRTSVENVRKQLVKRYQSPQAAESFVNFSRGMGSPKFLQAEDEEIKAYFNKTLAPKLINVVTSIGIIDDNSKYPSDVAAKFANNSQVGGLYDPKTNAIYFNPSSFVGTGETDLKTITATTMEEFQHAIDGNTKVGDLFPSLAGKPQAGIQFAPSMSLGRALLSDITRSPKSKEEQGVVNQQEFYAKFQVIKSKLREKHPKFFDEKGNIKQDALENVINMPRMYFDQGEVDFRVFDMLKKSNPQQIRDFMNQLVKMEKTPKKDTQMA
mgnify:FL=1